LDEGYFIDELLAQFYPQTIICDHHTS